MSKSNFERRSFVTGLGAAAVTFALPSFAGSYLNRAVLVVRESKREGEYLRSRLDDLELARLVQRIAEGRLSASRRMVVPEEVSQAHPQLLLLLEHYERSANAAAERQASRAIALSNQASDEEQIFRGILRQLGFPLPD
jgi:hypothetical protein